MTIISLLLALGIITPFERGKAEALADSQASTLEAGTSKLRIAVRTGGPIPTRYTATGAYDYREQRGTFFYNFTKLPGFDWAAALEVRFFQDVAYWRRLPVEGTKPWLLIDSAQDLELQRELAEEEGDDPAPESPAVADVGIDDPTAVLSRMAAAGSVRDRGTARILGTELRKYSGSLPPARGRGRVAATAFIDSDDLVRRLELSTDGGSTTSMDFYDYGVTVDTKPPPASEVDVYAELLERQIREAG